MRLRHPVRPLEASRNRVVCMYMNVYICIVVVLVLLLSMHVSLLVDPHQKSKGDGDKKSA